MKLDGTGYPRRTFSSWHGQHPDEQTLAAQPVLLVVRWEEALSLCMAVVTTATRCKGQMGKRNVDK